jgi:hypothetical protein
MTDISDLIEQYHATSNPVTRSVLRLIIEKRVLRGEAGRVD